VHHAGRAETVGEANQVIILNEDESESHRVRLCVPRVTSARRGLRSGFTGSGVGGLKHPPNLDPGENDVELTAYNHLEQCRKRVADGKHGFERGGVTVQVSEGQASGSPGPSSILHTQPSQPIHGEEASGRTGR